MANGHGGRRAGAGRKPKAIKHEGAITAAEQQIADRLPSLLDKLFFLAEGGYERVEEKYQLAELLAPDGDGPTVPLDQTARELVLVEKKVTIAAPDRAALTYLADRILGKTPQHIELTGDDGGPIEVTETTAAAVMQELTEWQRQRMSELQSNLLNAPPTPPTPATNTA